MVHTNDLSRKSPEGLLLAPGQKLATGGRGLPGLWGGSTQWDRGCDRGDHWVLSGTERVPNPAWGRWGDIRHLEEVRLSHCSFAGLHMVSVVP